MFSEVGFYHTSAKLYLDISVTFFALLPFLLMGAILLAKNKHYTLHKFAQVLLFILMLGIVLLFEVGMRLDGGFLNYSKNASIDIVPLSILLFMHVVLAIYALLYWAWFLYQSFSFKGDLEAFKSFHKAKGKKTFFLVTISSYSGFMIYILLFYS